jgi:hypothetical protein
MSRLTEADRQELRALFSQLAEIQADAIIEELAEQPWYAPALKQEAHGFIARLADLHADHLRHEWAIADARVQWLKSPNAFVSD